MGCGHTLYPKAIKKLVFSENFNLCPSTMADYFQDILVDDEIWEQGVLESVDVDGTASLSPTSNFRAWTVLTEADFSNNDLPYIDESVVNTLTVITEFDLGLVQCDVIVVS